MDESEGPDSRGEDLRARPIAALPLLAAFAAVLIWLAWERGGYFAVTFLPGGMVLLGLLIVLCMAVPFPARLRGPALISLVGLLGVAGLTLLSALWSPAPDIAVEDFQRVLVYAVTFGLGLWACLLLGPRRRLALAPLALAGGVVAVATLGQLFVSDSPATLLEPDATLRYPIGYRNAVAAFFLMAVFPMVVLAADPTELDWRLRGLLLGTATLAIELAVLSQSRSSAFAVVIGVLVLIVAHPQRLRIAGWLTLAVLPALASLPWLLDVFQAKGGNTAASLDPLRTAAAAMALSSGASVLVGCFAAWRDPLITLSERRGRIVGRALAGTAIVIALAGATAAIVAGGGPSEIIDNQTEELTAGSPDLTAQGSRFGFDLRSERGDLWRVALDDFESNPVDGVGAGGWRFSYLRNRDAPLQPEDPHSVVMLMASELGAPGLLLFGTFVVAGLWAAIRSRRRGPAAATLVAGSLAVAGYWLVHASAEWFWSYPAITLPMAFVVGAAAAPGLEGAGGGTRRRAFGGLAVAAAIAALSFVPFFLAERYTNDGIRTGPTDPQEAYESFDRAADLNPLSDRALAAEAVLATSEGDVRRAVDALDAAKRRQPEEWTLYYLEALALADSDRRAAQAALRKARELNPRGPEIVGLASEIGFK